MGGPVLCSLPTQDPAPPPHDGKTRSVVENGKQHGTEEAEAERPKNVGNSEKRDGLKPTLQRCNVDRRKTRT
jgi:hypothetical protein